MNRTKRMDNRDNRENPERGARLPTFSKLRIARIGSGVGVLGIFGTLIIFLLQRELTPAVFLSLVIGIIGLTVWLSLAPDDLRTVITRRQAVYGSNSIVAVALFAGVVGLLYGLANNTNVRADLTAFRTYSLRPDVVALVKGLTSPAIITVFYTNRQLDKLSSDQPILRMFADAAPDKIRINVVDADAQPLTVQRFGATLSQSVFVTAVQADGQPDTSAGKIVAVSNNLVGEQQIADALLLLQAQGRFKIGFTVGHNEINGIADGGDASALWNGLRGQGFSVGTIDIAAVDIPQDTTVLVILAPKKDFTALETERVARYLGSGGMALILAEPNLFVNSNAPNPPLEYAFLQEGSPFAKYLEDSWGLKADNTIIYDPDPNYFIESQYLLLAKPASRHPILFLDRAGTRQFEGLFNVTRGLREVGQNASLQRTPLFRTSATAFGATQIRLVQFAADDYKRNEKDIAGPFNVAYAVQNTTNNARLVLFGDSDWIRNDSISQAGNAVLWSNVMDYLSQYTEKTSVSPTVRLPPMSVPENTLNTVVVVTLVLLPGLILLLGGYVWWDRARR
jgi:hypothetical protein